MALVDIFMEGTLLGSKLILNEFITFESLAENLAALDPRTALYHCFRTKDTAKRRIWFEAMRGALRKGVNYGTKKSVKYGRSYIVRCYGNMG